MIHVKDFFWVEEVLGGLICDFRWVESEQSGNSYTYSGKRSLG